MVGKAGMDAVFTFQNLLSIVKIEFPTNKLNSANERDINKIEFTAKEAIVAGNANISAGALEFKESSVKTLTFDCTETNIDAPLYVAIPAQTYVGGCFT